MSHYPYSEPVLSNDPEKQRSCYAKHGEWWEQVFRLVPVTEIRQHPLSPNKLEALKRALADGVCLLPVLLRKQKDGTFIVRDGNHRTELSKPNGFTHVPAVFGVRHTEPPR